MLALVFGLFGLLAINSLYLGGVSLYEWFSGETRQDYVYLLMFLLHLGLGLLLVPPFLLFGLFHQARARRRRNRYAIGAGFALFATGLLVLLSGLVLTRFGFFEIDDPAIRTPVYWVHVITPFLAAWLFVVHRLAGAPIRWRKGAYWALASLLLGVLPLALQLEGDEAPQARQEASFPPGQLRLVGNDERIPPRHLMQDEECAVCHADIARQSQLGMHRFSSFNNPAYRFSVEEARQVLLERDGEVTVARLCAACHDQVPLFSGQFDRADYDPDADPGSRAGIGCLGCHAITAINSPLGNGAYDFRDPPRYPFAFSDNPLLKALNHQLIKAKPEFHKATFLKPAHRQAEFCSACHKVHLPFALNHYKWLRGQNHYDSFLLSGVSGHRVDSFYYPPQAVTNCAQCHMPLQPSDDPAARDFDGKGQRAVHDHAFAAANTGVPHLLGQTESADAARREFMRRAARVDLFGLREEGDIDGPLHAPLRPALPRLQPGKRYLLELVVRTTGIGHQLTQGTTDSNELWLDLTLKSGDRVVGRSGGLDGQGDVDPWSYFLNSYVLDREGRRIERRNAQDIFVPLYDHQIPPGAATTVHYALALPEGLEGTLEIEARLQYRKFDSRFLRHVVKDPARLNDLPVTTLAEDRLVLPLGNATTPSQERALPEWERWNDYGIGLLRKGRKELRQAEEAFRRVEALQPDHGALNLARVQYSEGRIDEAAASLARAGQAGAFPWVLSWYGALVKHERGDLDGAIADLEALLDTRFNEARRRGFDFSRDYRARAELGRILFERARQERGTARQERRRAWLARARSAFEQVLVEDPENLVAHYNLALVFTELGQPEQARRHRELHETYRPDDLAVERAVTLHRSRHPAADHAAEETAIYDLQRPGAYGLPAASLASSRP